MLGTVALIRVAAGFGAAFARSSSCRPHRYYQCVSYCTGVGPAVRLGGRDAAGRAECRQPLLQATAKAGGPTDHSIPRPQAHLRHLAPDAERPPKFVQKLLGHRSIAITLDLYSHWIPDMGDFTADTMDDIL